MKSKGHINWDAMGITASILCAIHCTILPLVVAALPIFGFDIVHHPAFEYGMIFLAFVIGTLALWHGFRHHHRRLTPWLFFVAGMIFLIAKQIWKQQEFKLLPFAVGFIILAHLINYRLTKSNRHPAAAAPMDMPQPAPLSGSDAAIPPPLSGPVFTAPAEELTAPPCKHLTGHPGYCPRPPQPPKQSSEAA